MSQKRITLFIDGSGQKSPFKHPESTNVYKLYLAVRRGDHQLKEYIAGVGTNWSCLGNVFQQITGYGTAKRIKEAYKYLSENYNEDDRIYLFGYSRGALAARSLAGFVNAIGLLLKDHCDDETVEKAYTLYEEETDPAQSELEAYLRDVTEQRDFQLYPEDKKSQLPIYFIGVWDTVKALGYHKGWLGDLTHIRTQYHQTELPANITNARHALAMHERRKPFEPLLWLNKHPKNSNQSLQQVWFAGNHSDVGGGNICEMAI